jgi:hypothetical protein
LALERSWVITASTHVGLRSAGIVWFLLPARIARRGLGNVTICTNCRNLPGGGIRLPTWTTRSRGAGSRRGHRTNADESRRCRGPARIPTRPSEGWLSSDASPSARGRRPAAKESPIHWTEAETSRPTPSRTLGPCWVRSGRANHEQQRLAITVTQIGYDCPSLRYSEAGSVAPISPTTWIASAAAQRREQGRQGHRHCRGDHVLTGLWRLLLPPSHGATAPHQHLGQAQADEHQWHNSLSPSR